MVAGKAAKARHGEGVRIGAIPLSLASGRHQLNLIGAVLECWKCTKWSRSFQSI